MLEDPTFKKESLPASFYASVILGTAALLPPPSTQAEADPATDMEEITVVASSPWSRAEISEALPYSVQGFTGDDLDKDEYNSIADFLDRRASGVSVNHAQNNPLQPDVQVRGASPLLGAPQGLAVYMNGIRVNEAFGDTVNWDLLGSASIALMQTHPAPSPIPSWRIRPWTR